MNFSDTADEDNYRVRARNWLSENAGSKRSEISMQPRYTDDELLILAKQWQSKKFDGGFAGITLPKRYGGQGGSQIQQIIYEQEEASYITPRGVYEIGLGMCIPTMLAYATEQQKRRYIPPALKGEEIWCQLFSEPDAGSDLAGLKTRADFDGSKWILNGQKVWTSGAHFSDYGIIVARSDPSKAKHKGLTFFFLDMKTPGVSIKRIKQISGASNFNEVFFSEVEIPDVQRLGEIGSGWSVSMTTLMNERFAVGETPPPDFEEIFNLAKNLMLGEKLAIEDSSVREKLADWYVQTQGLRYTKFRTMTALSRGDPPGPEASITKFVSANKRQEIAAYAMNLMEMGGIINDEKLTPLQGLFQNAFLTSPAGRIAGGTDEILLNIIAERVLGLPPDLRIDKEPPFNQLDSRKNKN